MRNKFEYLLLSLLLGTSILLGLSFWLNTNYGFNLFYHEHWNELSNLQVSGTPINNGFYVSFIIAVLIFVIGVYIVYHPTNNKKTNNANIDITRKDDVSTHTTNITKTEQKNDSPVPIPNTPIARPPRLNLPTNMAQIVVQQQQTKQEQQTIPQKTQQNPYNSAISQIFSDNGYVVKTNPKISGFVPNLFAIGPNEVLWIGGVDVKTEDMQRAIEKLQSVFTETLEDIQINIAPFILDTMNQIQSNDSILIFKTIDDLKTFITENPAETISDEERDNFDSYSEYIDTVIQYIKNM